MADELGLKWGTLKFYSIESEEFEKAIDKLFEHGISHSAMLQDRTDEHKEALFEVIDACNGTIYNDWSGVYMTKDEAKEYVRNYGK